MTSSSFSLPYLLNPGHFFVPLTSLLRACLFPTLKSQKSPNSNGLGKMEWMRQEVRREAESMGQITLEERQRWTLGLRI